MAKGNRKTKEDGREFNTAAAVECAQKVREINDGYRKMAEAYRSRRKYTQEWAGDYYRKAMEYAAECADQQRPLTVAGVQLATGTNKDFNSEAIAGRMDYLLPEYMDMHDPVIEEFAGIPYDVAHDPPVILLPMSEIVQNVYLLIQQQLEALCYSGARGVNPAGAIFGLKAKFGWREDDGPRQLVQQLVIADKDQAARALSLVFDDTE